MNLKIGGSNVGKIMYGGQEFGGSQMLESGTILLALNGGPNFASSKAWDKRRLGLDFNGLSSGDSITCKVFGVEKDWKNVSKIGVYLDTDHYEIIDISDLKNGPCKVYDGKITVKLEGKELTFTNNGKSSYYSILVEAYNE